MQRRRPRQRVRETTCLDIVGLSCGGGGDARKGSWTKRAGVPEWIAHNGSLQGKKERFVHVVGANPKPGSLADGECLSNERWKYKIKEEWKIDCSFLFFSHPLRSAGGIARDRGPSSPRPDLDPFAKTPVRLACTHARNSGALSSASLLLVAIHADKAG